MFFKRLKGEFRETERITRFKLIKSGKTWVRASISQLGLFHVPHATTCEPFESVCQPAPSSFLKGIVALGALAGATTLANPVAAEENGGEVGIESETNLSTGLVGSDSLVLGTTAASESLSASQSMSASVSLSETTSESGSVTQSISLSESHVTSQFSSELHMKPIENVAEAPTQRSDEQVQRLQALALDLYTYREQALEIPGTGTAIENGDLALEAIRTGLSNPAIQMDAVESQAKIARNRLANAVLRATSGQRDPRTGSVITNEHAFRAPFFISGPGNDHVISAYNSDPIKLQYIVRERNGGLILTYMGYAPSSERVDGVLVPNATLKSAFAPMLIEGRVGSTEIVEPGKTYRITVRFTNSNNQFIDRSFRIKVLPQNDGIRNPIKAVTTEVVVNDPNNLDQAEKDQVWEAFRSSNPRIVGSKDFKSYSVSASGVVRITFKDNTDSDMPVPVKGLPAPTVMTRLLEKANTQTPVTVTGAKPGSTVVLYNNEEAVGTAVADASGQAIVVPTVPLQSGGVNAKIQVLYGDRLVYSAASNYVAVTMDSSEFSQSVSLSTSQLESVATSQSASTSAIVSLSASESVFISESVRASLLNSQSGSESASVSESLSESISESILRSESASASVSESQNTSVMESESSSTSVSDSVSISDSGSISHSESVSVSESRSESLSASVSESASVSVSISASISASSSDSESQSTSVQESESSSTSVSDSVSASISGSISHSESVSLSESGSESHSASVSEDLSESVSTSVLVSTSESISNSESVSSSVSFSSSASISFSGSVSVSDSVSVSVSGSISHSESVSVSASVSDSASVSTSTSVSSSVTESQSTSVQESESVSGMISHSESVSVSESWSESLSASVSESARISESVSASVLVSTSESILSSESVSNSASLSSSESLSYSASASVSDSVSGSDSVSISTLESVSTSESRSASFSERVSESLSVSESMVESVRASVSVNDSVSLSTSESILISEFASNSASLSLFDSASASDTISASQSLSQSQLVIESSSNVVSSSESVSRSSDTSASGNLSLSTNQAGEELHHQHSEALLPKTGTAETTHFVTGAIAFLAGLFLLGLRKQKDE